MTFIRGNREQESLFARMVEAARHRDSVFSGMMSVSSLGRGPAAAALVATAGIARRKTGRTGIRRFVSRPVAPAPFEEQLTDFVPAIGGGIDVLIRIRRRLSIALLFRLHYLADDDGGYPE